MSFLLVASLVLASCAKEEVVTPGEQEEEEEEEEEVVVPTAAVGEEPQYGGTVTWLCNWIQIEAETVGIQFDLGDHNAVRCVHHAYTEDLVSPGDIEKYGPRGSGEWPFTATNVVPPRYCGQGLAESWEITANTEIFHIRPGVMWAANPYIGFEAREFTADDAAFSINRWLNDPNAFVKQSWFDNAVAIDRYTLQVNLNTFNQDAIIWHYVFFGMYPPETVTTPGFNPHDWRTTVGTGPFILTDYVEDSQLTYKPNPNWWNNTTTINGKEYTIPFIDKLIYPIVTDESTQIAAIRTAKFDAIDRVFYKYKDTLQASCPDLVFGKYIFDNEIKMPLRCDRPPFDKVEVRRAMYQATDLLAIAKAVYEEGELYSFPVSSAGEAWTPPEERSAICQKLYDYDQVEAKRMLAEAGYPDGFTVTLSLPAGQIEFSDIAAMVVAMWAKVGVTVNLKVVETTALHAAVTAYDYGDAYLSGWGGTAGAVSHASRVSDAGTSNDNRLHDPILDKALVSAMSEVDYDTFITKAKALNLYVLEQAPTIGFCSPIGFHCWWPWLKNYWGEVDAGHLSPIAMIDRLWVDQDLKEEMGY